MVTGDGVMGSYYLMCIDFQLMELLFNGYIVSVWGDG